MGSNENMSASDETILFATNRTMGDATDCVVSHKNTQFPITKVAFDLHENAPSPGVHFCERLSVNEYSILGRSQFFARLRKHSSQQVLLYIHGFDNLPEDTIFARTVRMQQLCNQHDPRLVVVVPLIWPCDNDIGALKDYWDDQKAADASESGFARMLEFFLGWRDDQSDVHTSCYKRVNIIAHSMGNRVLRGALENTSRRTTVEGLFRNIFMVAADVTNECLERKESGHVIPLACRNVTVYHANDDLALRASKVVNLMNSVVSRRLGHTGPERIGKTPANVYAIDCDDFNNTLDHPKGHSYFLTGNRSAHENDYPVLHHMLYAMRTGRVDANPITRSKRLSIDYRT